MDFFIMQYNYGSRYLVVKEDDVYVYKYGKCRIDQIFLSFRAKKIFNGK